MKESVQRDVLLGFYSWFLHMKTYHFLTLNYNHHKIVDGYLSKYSDLYDQFMEVCMGHHGKVKLTDFNLPISVINIENLYNHIDRFLTFLDGLKTVYAKYPDLLNIRDELEAETNQMVYLLRLN